MGLYIRARARFFKGIYNYIFLIIILFLVPLSSGKMVFITLITFVFSFNFSDTSFSSSSNQMCIRDSKQHDPPLVRGPANSFEFYACEMCIRDRL